MTWQTISASFFELFGNQCGASDICQAIHAGREASTACLRKRPLGRVVQVDPIKPASKATGHKRLKLRYDELLSNVAFNFNLRRTNSSCSATAS